LAYPTFSMPNQTQAEAGRSASQDPAWRVGLLRHPGANDAMIYGLTDLLETASRLSANQGGRAVEVSCPKPAGGAENDRAPDVVIIPGRSAGPLDAISAAPLAAWLTRRHAEGTILASVCVGAFLLAETGLLAGRPATTHWLFAEAFRARFPNVDLDADRIVIDDGDILTAGGLMAWTDLGLRLIDRLLGRAAMLETARYFLIDVAGREQRHYSRFRLDAEHGDAAVSRAQAWLHAREARAVSVTAMAREAGLEERTFLRRFKVATGLAPSEYAQRVRLDKARELLQTTHRPISQIAWDVGYEDAAAFGRLFQRSVGLTPGEYRRRFSVPA
jgi:transcriptional regulator GlxA family with amidase domain